MFFSTILALFLSGSWFAGERALDGRPAPTEGKVTKAIVHNGEVLPMIELPVVEITAGLSTDYMTTARVIGNEVVPVIELPEVVITPQNSI